MNFTPPCFVYTQDAGLQRRLSSYLAAIATVTEITDPRKVEVAMQRFDPTVLLLDLHAPEADVLVSRLTRNLPNSAVVALGEPRSEPFRQAEQQGCYSVEDADCDRHQLKATVARALQHVSIVQENLLLREEPLAESPSPRRQAMGGDANGAIFYFSRAYRQIDNLERMLENVVEGVASFARVARLAIFANGRQGGMFRFRAGIKCLPDVQTLEVAEDDPLIQWLQINAHMISSATLAHLSSSSERMLLVNCLKALGAEVIIPLHGRDRLFGWMAVGQRVTGIPFDEGELENLMQLAELVSITLENAMLYEEVAVQKTVAETVLQSVPIGIVSVGADGDVRWFNEAAEAILAIPAASVVGKPAARLGGMFAEIFSKCLKEGDQNRPVEWEDARTKRSISVVARGLRANDQRLGAVAIVHDLTQERLLKEQKDQLERATFWTELAAAMSHEVRNPLVAVSTFAQLLPERYSDAEFRHKFSELVSKEIGRLNKMLDQIDAFANPPRMVNSALNIDVILNKAIDRALLMAPTVQGLKIEVPEENSVLKVQGDETALIECFTHIIVNAIEAIEGVENPLVRIQAKAMNDGNAGDGVVVNVQDNGAGIPAQIRDKVYSPFCTTKARGIGLGLPIARRTIMDHRGQINIESGEHDTNVTVVLPSAESGRRELDEAHSGRG